VEILFSVPSHGGPHDLYMRLSISKDLVGVTEEKAAPGAFCPVVRDITRACPRTIEVA